MKTYPEKLFYVSDGQFKIFIVLLAGCIGMIVRFPYFMSDDIFPLGDGGLFVEMIYSIKANHYFLPSYVNYNSYQIPFVYPPLGFYLALFSSKVFSEPVLYMVRILPITINLLTVISFALLASELIKDRIELLICSGLFPIIFQVYQWTAKGGGLTRSPGFLFTVLALYFFLQYYKKDEKYYLALAALALGLVYMSHLEWALIAIASCFIFIVAFGTYKSKKHFYDILVLSLGSALVSLPWWGIVLYRFGIAPFISAWSVAEMNTSQLIGKFFAGSAFSVTILPNEDYFLPVLGVIGFASNLIYKKDLLFPVWFLILYIVAPKNSPISGLLPLVIMIAIGLRNLDRILYYLAIRIKIVSKNKPHLLSGKLPWLSISIIYLFVTAFLSLQQLIDRPVLQAISRVDRAAMEYVERNSPKDSRFIVLTPADWYSADEAEWFPYLAKRQSLTTPQGLEWLSVFEFNKIVGQVAALSQMVRYEQSGVEPGRLVDYIQSNFKDYEFVAIFANNLEKEFGGFLETGHYEIFYRKRDVLIFRLISQFD